MATDDERRGAARFPQDLEIDLHSKADRIRMRAVDVSRHGIFIACIEPPPLNHAVLMTVRLRGGPFETMATVVRRVTQHAYVTSAASGRGGSSELGMGLKLFCLGADAKDRWDRFVASLETPGLELPTRPSGRSASACFLVQRDTTAELSEFYMQNVGAPRTLYVSPAVRLVGAQIDFVLVHPRNHSELVLKAHVVEWNPDHPLRMGVRFDKVDTEARRAFKAWLGPEPRPSSVPDGAPLVSSDRPHWTEYAYFSPKVRARSDPSGEIRLLSQEAPPIIVPPTSGELDVIEGELLDLPELQLVDRKELFDFAWNAEAEATDPNKRR